MLKGLGRMREGILLVGGMKRVLHLCASNAVAETKYDDQNRLRHDIYLLS